LAALVHHKFEFGWSINGQISRPLAFQDTAPREPSLSIRFEAIVAVAQQSSGLDISPRIVGRRNSIACGEFRNLMTPAVEKLAASTTIAFAFLGGRFNDPADELLLLLDWYRGYEITQPPANWLPILVRLRTEPDPLLDE
jgi:hypothetical protein